jgi:hypothetical protein
MQLQGRIMYTLRLLPWERMPRTWKCYSVRGRDNACCLLLKHWVAKLGFSFHIVSRVESSGERRLLISDAQS